MFEKLKSPVVWGVLFSTILAQLELLSQESVDGWKIAMAACTVLVAVFGALNNPDSRENF